MTADTAYEELTTRLAELKDLDAISGLLAWDQQTMMPPRAGAVRAEQMATLARIAHQRFTDPVLGRLLDALDSKGSAESRDVTETATIRLARREWKRAQRVPMELAAELAHAGAIGFDAWVEARAASDFAGFLPTLERMVELKRRYAACFEGRPYDVLLDDYEEGLTANEVSDVFNRLKTGLLPIIARVRERIDDVDDSCLTGDFPVDRQSALMNQLTSRVGFESGSWRLDPTAHPFAQSLATTDIRLTTRYSEQDLAPAVFGTIHECGHGLYEEGVDPALERTILANGCSAALHESQSRMWENQLGRSRAFWQFAFPIVRDAFPEQFSGLDANALYRAANKVIPSLIRVEADEVTYPLHVIIRFEIERDLFEGDLKLADLPEIWNAKMREYLGVEVPDDARGVLQDVHWAEGLFGYFPTYALGTVLAAQIWQRVRQDVPDIDEHIAQGELITLREWAREHVHRFGRTYTPKETIRRVVGGPIDPEPFLRYVTAKVDDLYGV